MNRFANLLAQGGPPVDKMKEVYPYLIALFLMILVGGLFLMWFRARLKAKNTQEEPMGFSLSDLKKLRDQGELTIPEYEAARAKMLAKSKKMLLEADEQRKKPKESPPDPSDG